MMHVQPKGYLVTLALVLAVLIAPRAGAIAGLEGTFEFGLDAPWRLEPNRRADGSIEYGAIPIQITIHDAMHANLDDVLYSGAGSIHLPQSLVSLGTFRAVRVKEIGPTETRVVEFPASALYEIERTIGAWPWPAGQRPRHELCRIWAGQNPEPCRIVSRSSEWHATLWYVPTNRTPGTTVALQVEVVLTRSRWPTVRDQDGGAVNIDVAPTVTLRNFARVLLAPAPMPRFDKRWIYGDFHYHAQGTDNEGEAAYNYRGVVRTMGAMGLDFLFATDHASNSEQIVDADLPPVSLIPEIVHDQGDKLLERNVRSIGGVLRDMSADRYAFAHELIYGDKGVNKEAAARGSNAQLPMGLSRLPQNFLSYGVMPQLFLGGELDTVPEVSNALVRANTTVWRVPGIDKINVQIPYGNGLRFDLATLCKPKGCDDDPRQPLLGFGGGDLNSSVVFDFQGIDSFNFYGREHLIYFPASANLRAPGGDTTFVASNTSRFGGATRRLDSTFDDRISISTGQPPLLPEIERKGVAFIAHHLNGGGGNGPNGMPWTTDHMLLKAFRSPAILGLQFWNEDTRKIARVCSHAFCQGSGDGTIYAGMERGYERNEKLEADSNNLLEKFAIWAAGAAGIDLLPEEYNNIALPLEEVRRGFHKGGANGSLFELVPFDVVNDAWQRDTDATRHELNHGAYDWDMMNLRGLDFEQNASLSWLPRGEPRRMFMGGGSDAHGDLNYRRAGYFLGTADATDTAIGKPRNLVFAGVPTGNVIHREEPAASTDRVAPPNGGATGGRGEVGPPATTAETDRGSPPPNPSGGGGQPPFGDVVGIGQGVRAHSQEQIIDALRRGRFSVTDGPAIRIAIDRNGNNKIDDGDVQMGDVLRLTDLIANRPSTVTLLTEVMSTSEFGPIQGIDVYIGVHPGPRLPGGPPVEPRVYAPRHHGPGAFDGIPGQPFAYHSQGRSYIRQNDRYWTVQLGDDLMWRHTPGDQLTFAKTFVTTLRLNLYEVGKGVTANRFFVRAFASSFAKTGRYGYSNPIWVVRAPISLSPNG